MLKDNHNIISSGTRKRRIASIAFALAATGALTLIVSPSSAFAAQLNITQVAESGGTNPASHITVKDDTGAVVSEFDYAGGSASIDPVQVDMGKSYTVDATADGYDFQAKGGSVTQDAIYPVELVAVKAANLVIQFNSPGVSDYSGITVALFKGADTSGTPQSTATTDASGKVTISNVPHGDYTLSIVAPTALAQAGFPTSKSVTVPADNNGTVSITVSPESQQSASQPASSTSAVPDGGAQSSSTSVAGSSSSTDNMSQTDDGMGRAVALALTSAGAVCGFGALALKRRKMNR